MKTLLAILVVAIVLLQLKMWFGEGGYRDVQRLAARVEEQARENEILAQRNRQHFCQLIQTARAGGMTTQCRRGSQPSLRKIAGSTAKGSDTRLFR